MDDAGLATAAQNAAQPAAKNAQSSRRRR